MIFYYVRHGDPTYDPDSLTGLGKRQAEAVAKRLCVYGLNKIFVSSAERAKMTAKPTCEVLKMEATVLDWCNEIHAWNELKVKDKEKEDWCFLFTKYRKLFSSERIRLLGEKWYEDRAFNGKKFGDGIKRIQKETDLFFENLGYKHDRENRIYIPVNPNEERVALFAHQGFGVAFLSSVLDIPYPEFSLHFDISHSSVTIIEFKEIDGIVIPKVLTMSNDSHLFREGLPTAYNNAVRI